MARNTGPKDKISRRFGIDLYGKGPKFTRVNTPPGYHGSRRKRNISDYGLQMLEKQKAKSLYGVLEKQFQKYVAEALKSKDKSTDKLISILESRLDNVIYRLGFVNSRREARQLVTHRHILVNGKKVCIPSYEVKEGDTVVLGPKAIKIPGIESLVADKDREVPTWLERKAAGGRVLRSPTLEDFNEPISPVEIIEFYSR
jgi:small subunit ribosomal protein S4